MDEQKRTEFRELSLPAFEKAYDNAMKKFQLGDKLAVTLSLTPATLEDGRQYYGFFTCESIS